MKSGCFAANYWVTGRIQHSHDGSFSCQPNDSVNDTAFHVLKLVDYMDLCKEYGDEGQTAEQLVRRILGDVWVPWFHDLDDLDKRASFTWQHATDKSFNAYRLSDHFWVWKALKALYDSGVPKRQPSKNFSRNETAAWNSVESDWMLYLYNSDSSELKEKGRVYEKFGKVVKRLHPNVVQRGILQCFMAESDVLRRRMLAVTRTTREKRFLLHARDTALFYGQDCGFFLSGSYFQDLWDGTIEAQMHHNESEDSGWDKALRYALGIVAGCRHLTLNHRSSNDMVRECVEVLIRSTSHNGFFPGLLNVTTKDPELFDDERERDSYYHANFEINCILLTHARAINEQFGTNARASLQRPESGTAMSSSDRENEPRHQKTFQSEESLTGTTARSKGRGLLFCQPSRVFKDPNSDRHVDNQSSLVMKKAIPHNNLINANSIIDIQEEWLYPFPHFLSTARVDVVKQVRHYLDLYYRGPIFDVIPTLAPDDFCGGPLGGVISRELDSCRKTGQAFVLKSAMSSRRSPNSRPKAFAVDLPKQKHLGKRGKTKLQFMTVSLDNVELAARLGAPRTAEQAKRRFIWLPHANTETAIVCWTVSPDQEKAAISRFFDRHSRYEKHIWDGTVKMLNTWQTEVHLSFHVLVHTSKSRHIGLPPLTAVTFPGNSKQEIRRASMGFRFDGDVFNRYWTCHYIEHVPSKEPQILWQFPFSFSSKGAEKKWWQRKVLELYLMDCILQEIAKSTVHILNQVRKELGVGDTTLSFSILEDEAYSASKDNWYRLEQILHTVEEDLASSLDTLRKWSSREEDRGQEQPRWTCNDERKYSGAVKEYRRSTELQIRELDVHCSNIRMLKDKLAANRRKIRDDRELRRNENIRYFTYVTVIFLPLDFAASFYSMNGTPENDVLVSLVKFAAGAFAVTIVLLAGAKMLFSALDLLVVPIRRVKSKAALAIKKYSQSAMEESSLVYCAKYHPGKSLAQVRLESRSLSPRSFWLAYIFVEIPARRVLFAVSELKDGNLSARAISTILLGLMFIPVFGTGWLMRILFLNICDAAALLGE